jgi:hypothetical protein
MDRLDDVLSQAMRQNVRSGMFPDVGRPNHIEMHDFSLFRQGGKDE